jgi:phospholipid/cholesterol/gamma-HCH transport system ATP-binding protein
VSAAPLTLSTGPAIEVTGLSAGYDDRVLLQDVTFNVARGEIFFIIGGSGCGKTTLLRNLVGLRKPLAGDVRFLGMPFAKAERLERKKLLRTFGMLFQTGALWSSLTLRQNVALPLEEYTDLTKKEINQIATFKLSQVGLAGYEDYFPAEISGGMKKRAGLARALALDPSIVFFDEPSAGLDPMSSRKLDDLIRQIRDTFGTTIVVVSHELASIMDIADRVIMLDGEAKGIIAEGNPHQLLETSEDHRVLDFLSRGTSSGHQVRFVKPSSPTKAP